MAEFDKWGNRIAIGGLVLVATGTGVYAWVSQGGESNVNPSSSSATSLPDNFPTSAAAWQASVTVTPGSESLLPDSVKPKSWEQVVAYRAPRGEVDLSQPQNFVNADCENGDPATPAELIACIGKNRLLQNFLTAEGADVSKLTTDNVLSKVSYKDLAHDLAGKNLGITEERAKQILGEVGQTRLMTFRKTLQDGKIVLGTADVTLVDRATKNLDELDVNKLFWEVTFIDPDGKIRKVVIIEDQCENPMGLIIPGQEQTPTVTPTITTTATPTHTPTPTSTSIPTLTPTTFVPTATPVPPTSTPVFPTPTEISTQPPLPTATPIKETPTPTKTPTPIYMTPTSIPPQTPLPTATSVETKTSTPTLVPTKTKTPCVCSTKTPTPIYPTPTEIPPQLPLPTATPIPPGGW